MARVRMNEEKLLDHLGAFLEVERAGEKLYSQALEHVKADHLRPTLQEFHDQTKRHCTILEKLIRDCGGDPSKTTASAKIVKEQSQGLLDYMQRNVVEAATGAPKINTLGILGDLLMAEMKDHADWSLLGKIAEEFRDDRIMQAVRQVEPEEDRHVSFFREQITSMMRQELRAA